MTSWVVMQKEQCQALVERSDATLSINEKSNDTETLDVAACTSEEEGLEDEVGYRHERVEQAEGQGWLPPH